MDNSSLLFITCDDLREAFDKCLDDINKRILIIDVRAKEAYDRSHLCLDPRHDVIPIKTKMRVMNIDPNLISICTSKKIMSLLNENDLKVFHRRKDATEVILIDEHADDIDELLNPKSKVARVTNALTKYDNQIEERIVVPVQILKGGFSEWRLKYPHFTTDPFYEPDRIRTQIEDRNSKVDPPRDKITIPVAGDSENGIGPNSYVSHTQVNSVTPLKLSQQDNLDPAPLPTRPSAPTRIINTPPSRPPNKPNLVKNAPGTAVPVTPIMMRSSLPRSHSSPNVAQPEDRMNDLLSEVLENFTDKKVLGPEQSDTYNDDKLYRSPQMRGSLPQKPRFDRTLKPAFNNEFLNVIRAQLNFGRSPEASGKAITGLQNLGNTCFMNSVIQCLAYIPSLVSYFCSDIYYNHINYNSKYGSGGELAIELGALIEKLNAHRHRYVEPKSFRESVVKHIGFAGNEQQDSHEFMMMLFEKLHHDLNVLAKDKTRQNGIVSSDNDSNINIPRATLGYQFWKRHLELNKSIISDLFEGIFMSTLTCTVCKGQSNTFEVFNCLSLPIPSETRCNVKDCLNHFTNPERIDAAWECPRCKQKREAEKKIVICKLPRILIIHLKRFSLDGRWRQKLQTTVDFPLSDLVVDYTNVLPQSAYGSMPYKSSYNLCAVVNHYGHLDGGHYTAYCKLENQRWYTFDDSNVSEMRDTDVCGQAAYMLFYSAVC